MKRIWNTLKSLWNIYGGIILSTLIAWLNDFSKASMDNITSFLVLTLTCISVLTFLKITIFKKKPSGLVDTASLSQSSIKAMKTAVDPMAVGEEIGGAIVETYKIIKKGRKSKMLNWVKKNKGALGTTLLAILTIVGYVCTQIDEQFGAIFVYNGWNIIGLVGGISTVVVGVLTSPFTSAKLQEAFDDVKNVFKKNKVEAKETSKLLNAELTSQIKALTTEYEEYVTQKEAFEQTIRTHELLSKCEGYVITQEQNQNFRVAVENLPQVNAQIESLGNKIEILKAQIR